MTDARAFCPSRPMIVLRRGADGFTYIALLMAAAVAAAGSAATLQVWHTIQQRENERELLFIGQQFRRALDAYAGHAAAGQGGSGPQRLEDLLADPRRPGVHRYLRRIFVDPMTGRAEWGVVRAPSGEITGVYSLSTAVPLKQANFAAPDRHLAAAERYRDWVFTSGAAAASAAKAEPERMSGMDGDHAYQSTAVPRR